MKFLIDQNADFFGQKLEKMGHEVTYVAKLREWDEKYRNDYIVIDFAKENNMVLVTKDRENGQTFQDTGMRCIWISDERIFEEMVIPYLQNLENQDDS